MGGDWTKKLKTIGLDSLREVLLGRSHSCHALTRRKPNLKYMKTAGSIYVTAYEY